MIDLEQRYETLLLEFPAEAVAQVTLNRPDRFNAMTVTMFGELESVARTIADDRDVRGVILTGAGKAFCAGYDLDEAEELASLSALGMLDRQERAARALSAIRAIPVPVIAAVNGPAAGGGMSLTLMADIRLGSPAAAEIGFTGRIVEAEEAERLGLLNRVTGPDDLLDETLAMAAQICANSPGGIRMSKRALQANMEVASFAAALELENRGQALLTRCDDMTEALQAFKAKRAPTFS